MNLTASAVEQERWVAGHQPNFLPWFGYFEKWLSCDVFVHSDDVQFPSKSYTNRVQLLLAGRSNWLTLPVHDHGSPRISEVRFSDDRRAQMHVLNKLQAAVHGERHCHDIKPLVELLESLMTKAPSLGSLNIEMNEFIATLVGIDVPAVRGSNIGLEQYSGTRRLVARCQLLGACGYLHGRGTSDYQDNEMLRDAGIELRVAQYRLTQSLFGELASYSVVQGIARAGLDKIRNAVEARMADRQAQSCR